MSTHYATHYGSLGGKTAIAAQLVIAKTGNAAIIALNTVHLTLGLRPDRPPVAPPSQSPADRWHRMLVWLFGELADLSPDGEHQLRIKLPVDFGDIEISEEENRTAEQLIGAAGGFLLAETRKLGNQIDTWVAVELGDPLRPDDADTVRKLRTRLVEANNAAQTLLRMVGTSTWHHALAPQPVSTTDSVTTTPAKNLMIPAARSSMTTPINVVSAGHHHVDAGWRHRIEDALYDTWSMLSQWAVVVIDTSRREHTADVTVRIQGWIQQMVIGDNPEPALRELIITTCDRSRVEQVTLEVEPSARLHRRCVDAVTDAVRIVLSSEFADGHDSEPSTDPLTGAKEVLAALAYAATTFRPRQLLVMSDLPSSATLGINTSPDHDPDSGDLHWSLSRLLTEMGPPPLAGTTVTVAALGDVEPSMEFWQLACSESDTVTLLADLDHDTEPGHDRKSEVQPSPGRTVPRVGGNTLRRRRRRRRTTRDSKVAPICSQGVTVVLDGHAKPRRVLAGAWFVILVGSISLAVIGFAVGMAGSGVLLAGLLAAIAAIVMVLVWTLRGPAVTTLASVASAAIRVATATQSAKRVTDEERRHSLV